MSEFFVTIVIGYFNKTAFTSDLRHGQLSSTKVIIRTVSSFNEVTFAKEIHQTCGDVLKEESEKTKARTVILSLSIVKIK